MLLKNTLVLFLCFSMDLAVLASPIASPEQVAAAITNGHAFYKHIHEFYDLGIYNKAQFQKNIAYVMCHATEAGELKSGRSYFYDARTNTLVIFNPNATDYGTAFRVDKTHHPDPLAYIHHLS